MNETQKSENKSKFNNAEWIKTRVTHIKRAEKFLRLAAGQDKHPESDCGRRFYCRAARRTLRSYIKILLLLSGRNNRCSERPYLRAKPNYLCKIRRRRARGGANLRVILFGRGVKRTANWLARRPVLLLQTGMVSQIGFTEGINMPSTRCIQNSSAIKVTQFLLDVYTIWNRTSLSEQISNFSNWSPTFTIIFLLVNDAHSMVAFLVKCKEAKDYAEYNRTFF